MTACLVASRLVLSRCIAHVLMALVCSVEAHLGPYDEKDKDEEDGACNTGNDHNGGVALSLGDCEGSTQQSITLRV